MNTDTLIRSLTRDLAPVPRRPIDTLAGLALGGGVLVTLLIVLSVFGARTDLARALTTFPFWLKWTYAGVLCAIAGAMTMRLAYPGVRPLSGRWLALPVAALSLVAAVELARAPLGAWSHLWLGHSALQCPVRIAVLSVPIFFSLCVPLRRLAPTNLRATGAAAALAAGACASIFYGLACDETSASFLLAWYSLGIGLATAIGALTGPRLLRW